MEGLSAKVLPLYLFTENCLSAEILHLSVLGSISMKGAGVELLKAFTADPDASSCK